MPFSSCAGSAPEKGKAGTMSHTSTASLPPEVGRVVVALCGDYDRRERALRSDKATASRETLRHYNMLNRAIDRALAEVCEEPIRHQLLHDIGERRGARRTSIITMSEGTYKRRKRDSTYRIAKELRLL